MAINLSCWNIDCKYYFEDFCTEHVDDKIIFLDKDGECTNFQKGKSDWYDDSDNINVENL